MNTKQLQILLVCFFASGIDAVELGRFDTGEYCHKVQGSGSCQWSDQLKSDLGNADEYDQIFQYTNWSDKKMNFNAVRASFPIFNETVQNNKPFVFFDSAATAQMPQSVFDAIEQYYLHYKANVGRGMYQFAEHATEQFELARCKVAQFIGAQKREIVFTPGTTAGINLIADIWACNAIGTDDEIIVSAAEHNANFIPWQQLAKRNGAKLIVAPLNEQKNLDLDTLKTLINAKTKLVAITHQSNVLGSINDIATIVDLAHAVGAKVLVDAAQSIAHQKIDVSKMQCDFLVFSGHKLYGPTGVGVLYIKNELCCQCALHNFGGGIVYDVTEHDVVFKEFPYCLEPGTPAIASVVGLGAAIDFVQNNIDFVQAAEHETLLVRMLVEALQKMLGVRMISVAPEIGQHANMVTFSIDGMHAYDVAEYLGERGIAVRAGYHCAQMLYKILHADAGVRVSIAVYNTVSEVQYLIECLESLLINKQS